ncbi:hypothetical protein [Plasticicumulans acidivorans]|uniref:Uncharacterized protein n=1 Tax=Plasticicumulans acidivorans TaxID=886464 RepID=A0A317MSM5_9GAMM|nr:hypothetical protein [Plasticicumulans acidivorans]PWV59563.1 hypothetical protein C7443_110108 [Plasticicumulans acidivorans]
MNTYLLTGAGASALAALLHIGCVAFGAPWYRFFGAGDRMVALAQAGSVIPSVVTLGITAVLLLWSAYAFAGAGILFALPLERFALCAISAVYCLRGLAGMVFAITAPGERSVAFWGWSSAICLGIGVVHVVGLSQVWPQLS